MANVVRVQHHSKGYAALLKSADVQVDLLRRAERIAAASGNGFEAEQSAPRRRARAAVIAASGDARARNSRDNTLLRNLDAGR